MIIILPYYLSTLFTIRSTRDEEIWNSCNLSLGQDSKLLVSSVRNPNIGSSEFGWCCVLVRAQLCLTFCDLMDCSPPGSSVQGIFQARILKWVAISFSKGSSLARDETCISGVVSCIGRWILYHWDTWKAPYIWTVREKEVSFSAWAISLKGLLLPSSKEATGIALRWTTPLLKHNTLKKYKNI